MLVLVWPRTGMNGLVKYFLLWGPMEYLGLLGDLYLKIALLLVSYLKK